MHAYLFVSNSSSDTKIQVSSLAVKLKAKILEYSLQKIEDVRNLNNLLRLSFEEPTLIVCENINDAGEEALNAFLKNLEEPQENVYFALTAPSIRKVMPTIVSRCQVVKVKTSGLDESTSFAETERFLKMSKGEKLAFVDKIKDREDAMELAVNTVNLLHSKLHSDRVKYSVTAKNIITAIKTLGALKANGNVKLQLTNFVINFK
jgi:DNA polymerase III delta prime subunit